jgi:2-C-methyl-D-erythritol 4-phosphate cytidylyltransferase
VEWEVTNIKITRPMDMILAEELIRGRERAD